MTVKVQFLYRMTETKENWDFCLHALSGFFYEYDIYDARHDGSTVLVQKFARLTGVPPQPNSRKLLTRKCTVFYDKQ